MPKHIWLDADPGHDDAMAILLALHLSEIKLLGISTTHGNTSSHCTALNAARCLHAFGADRQIRVYPGASKPLILPVKYDAEIHGEDGLGGVEGLLPQDDPSLLDWFAKDSEGATIRALEGMATSIRTTWNKGAGSKVHVVATGPMTNIALFVSAYPDLLHAVEEFVFMGGGVGVGNRSPAAGGVRSVYRS
ncbi:hypothetical protein HGRIS_010257 [Hohenbuehelia grisea]|uniref:Inosine/uridine-preferring nucleoside hydrolase domain-containing protein n=1 Tax=Hohenbuehelia grisea TaxID=104357 RepID=A0ABR3J3X9_9AGAR